MLTGDEINEWEPDMSWAVEGGAFRLFRGAREQWAITDPLEAQALMVILADGDAITLSGPDGDVDVEDDVTRLLMIRDLADMCLARMAQ